jgi:hypothetical protein
MANTYFEKMKGYVDINVVEDDLAIVAVMKEVLRI